LEECIDIHGVTAVDNASRPIGPVFMYVVYVSERSCLGLCS